MLVKRWLPSVLMCILIFSLSSLGGASISADPGVDRVSHKFTHMVIYFVLTLTFYRGSKSVIISVLLTILYGITDEIHQLYVPTRSGHILDILTDASAGIIAGGFLWKLKAEMPKTLKNWLDE